MPSAKRQTMIEVPPSTEYLILDAQGLVLAKDPCPAMATRRARTEIDSAVAVLGSPSGVLLAHIVRGPTDARPALRAQAAWKKTEGAALTALADARAARKQAKRDRKNMRRRAKRLRLREARELPAEAGAVPGLGPAPGPAPALVPVLDRRGPVLRIAWPVGLHLRFGRGLRTCEAAPSEPCRLEVLAPRPEAIDPRLTRARARQERKNARRREKRRLAREARKAPGSIPPDPARESGVRTVGERVEGEEELRAAES